jgi:hypothetical protein
MPVTHAFVSGIADDPAAAALGEVLPSHWNASHVGIRDVLTADTPFYVSATGLDTNSGTLASPWLTLQHAVAAIAAGYDLGGKLITLNVGAGTFAGFGTHTFVGGGIFLLKGAGVGLTFITDGPNDGLFNGGECISTFVSQGVDTTIYVVSVTMSSASNSIFGLFQPGVLQFGLPTPYGTGSIALVGTTGLFMVNIAANLVNFGDTENSIGTVTLSGNCLGYIQCSGLSEVFLQSTYTISGTPAWSEAFIELFEGAVVNAFPAFSGAATGRRFNGVTGAVFDAGGNGINFFPGSLPGTLDASSSYDGFKGPIPGVNTQTANYQLVIGDNQHTVEMNLATANTVTIPPNSTVAFPVGARINVVQVGVGATTFVAGAGVTIDSYSASLGLLGQWAIGHLYKRGTDEWVLYG